MWRFCKLAWVHILYRNVSFFYFQAKPMSTRPFFGIISVVVGGRLKMSLGTILKSSGWRSWISSWPWCLVLISCHMSMTRRGTAMSTRRICLNLFMAWRSGLQITRTWSMKTKLSKVIFPAWYFFPYATPVGHHLSAG